MRKTKGELIREKGEIEGEGGRERECERGGERGGNLQRLVSTEGKK